MSNWTIQRRGHLEDGCCGCHDRCHSANLYGRTAVNSTRGKTEESLGVLGKKRKKLILNLKKWWRWRESNSRPEMLSHEALQA